MFIESNRLGTESRSKKTSAVCRPTDELSYDKSDFITLAGNHFLLHVFATAVAASLNKLSIPYTLLPLLYFSQDQDNISSHGHLYLDMRQIKSETAWGGCKAEEQQLSVN